MLPITVSRIRFSDVLKRCIDILASVLALLFLMPFFVVISLAVKRSTPGPIFYRGKRLARYGNSFYIIKFRTMYETPQSYKGPKVTATDDPRITPLGQWLRDTKLNELPQFWNVLKGDMSLVGPRPEDPELASHWPPEVAQEILSVRPGITSPASVQYHDEENFLETRNVLSHYLEDLSPDKQRMDQLYVRYRSFAMDLDVLLWTVLILLPRIQSNPPPEHLLFVGPISRLSRWFLNWFSIDLIITFAAFYLTAWGNHQYFPQSEDWLQFLGLTAGYALLFHILGMIRGVNRIAWSKASFTDGVDLAIVWVIAFLIMIGLNYYFHLFPMFLLTDAMLFSMAGSTVVRFRSRIITSVLSRAMQNRRMGKVTCERILIVGSGRTAESIAWMFDHPSYKRKFEIIGFIDDDLTARGARIYGGKVIGKPQEIATLVKKYDVGVIILADHRLDQKKSKPFINECKSTGASVIYIPDIYGTLSILNRPPANCIKGEDENDGKGVLCEYCLAKNTKAEDGSLHKS